MTNEQHIENLKKLKSFHNGSYGVDIDRAIRAIEQEPKPGHWRHYEGMLICSECGTEFYDDIMEYCGDYVPKCCPNCGAKMIEPQESDRTCHTCKHYLSGERDGSCGSYICKGYSNWESEDKECTKKI